MPCCATTSDRVCITGAAGFIGSHLSEHLLRLGWEVVGVDNFNDYYSPARKAHNVRAAQSHPAFQLIRGDIRDRSLMERVLQGCSHLIHLAAMAGVRASQENPQRYQDVNLGGTVCLLEACRSVGISTVVFASSSSVYSNNSKVPFAETDRLELPSSIYAATKRAGELICHAYAQNFGMEITCLRFFSVYGPRQRPDQAIHKFSSCILQERPIPFFGDGLMERDHTYVSDVVEGIEASLRTCAGGGYRELNLGSEHTTRLDQLVQLLEHALDKKAIIQRLPTPACEARRTWADLTRARELLGYEPKVSLQEGLERFVEWLNQSGPLD